MSDMLLSLCDNHHGLYRILPSTAPVCSNLREMLEYACIDTAVRHNINIHNGPGRELLIHLL